MVAFAIKDCGGVVHHLNVSTDLRGTANDALPRNMSSRSRVARDQELDDLFNGLDEETAFALACELQNRFPGLKQRLDRLPAENNGNDDTGDYTTRTPDHPTPIPGQPQRGGTMAPMNRSRTGGAEDSAIAARRRMSAREDTMTRFPGLRRIGGA